MNKLHRKLRSYAIASLVAVGLGASATAVYAANWDTCNGSPVIWRGTLEVHRNRCSIPDTGTVNSAYWNGVLQWDNLTSEVDSFLVRPADDCTYDTDDGMNEVALVNQSQIDGNNGVTFISIGSCFIGSNDIDQADLVVANSLSFSNPSPTFLGNNGRETFVHEFGHFFGFNHDEDHSVMRSSAPEPKTGGSETATVWPEDTVGINSIYGLNSAAPNLLPSAHRVLSGNVVNIDSDPALNVCRGQVVNSIEFYLGNAGKGNSGTYNLRIRLSTSSTGTGGTVAANFTHSLNAFSQNTLAALPFTVPAGLANGTYFVHVDLDHTGSIGEVREGDNSTISGRRITVSC